MSGERAFKGTENSRCKDPMLRVCLKNREEAGVAGAQ